MTSLDREQITVWTRTTRDAMEVWRRERKAALAWQLAVNAKIKPSWMKSNPIEITQQQGYHVQDLSLAHRGGDPLKDQD